MPYGSGELPKMGDYVKNKREQPGTVTAVVAAQAGHELVSISWDDGGADPPYEVRRRIYARLTEKFVTGTRGWRARHRAASSGLRGILEEVRKKR